MTETQSVVMYVDAFPSPQVRDQGLLCILAKHEVNDSNGLLLKLKLRGNQLGLKCLHQVILDSMTPEDHGDERAGSGAPAVQADPDVRFIE